jgi:hypothetical protein
MAWRVGPAYRRRAPARNRADFRDTVAQGPPPGLVALRAGTAVGWVQVTPRAAVPALEIPWRLRSVDDVPVWPLTCFYVRKGHLRTGIMSSLIDARGGVRVHDGRSRCRGVPAGRRRVPKRDQHGLRLGIRSRRVRADRSPLAGTTDHAAHPVAALEQDGVIAPKLFRRLVEFHGDSGRDLSKFRSWLATEKPDPLDLDDDSNFTHLDNVIEVTGPSSSTEASPRRWSLL